MKRFLVPLIAFATFTSSANAGQTKWVKSVSVPKDGYGVFIGKCNFFGGCPEGKPIYGSISIGQNIQGLEIGAIQCEKFNRTIEGWRGGPKFVSIAGIWNCRGSINKNAVLRTPGKNGDRPFAWVTVVGVKDP